MNHGMSDTEHAPTWTPVEGACGLYSAPWSDGTTRAGRRGKGGLIVPYSVRWSEELLTRHTTPNTRPTCLPVNTLAALSRGHKQYTG